MTQLRSFIIGATIALVVIGLGVLVFGASDDEPGESSASLIVAPTVSRFAAPTQSLTPRVTFPSTSPQASPGASTPLPVATATAQAATATAQAATATPAASPSPARSPTPAAASSSAYLDSLDPLLKDFAALLNYLVERAVAPQLGDPTWEAFVVDASEQLKRVAGRMSQLSPPQCLAAAQTAISDGANEGSAAADLMIAGARGKDAGQISQALTRFRTAVSHVNRAYAAIDSASC